MRFISILILTMSWQAFAFDGAFEVYLKGNKKCLFQKKDTFVCENIEISISHNERIWFKFKNMKRAHVEKWNELSRKIDLSPIFKSKTAEYSAYISKTLSDPSYNSGTMIELCLKGDSHGCDISLIVRADNDQRFYFLITDADSKY